jgi:hypothetical protein
VSNHEVDTPFQYAREFRPKVCERLFAGESVTGRAKERSAPAYGVGPLASKWRWNSSAVKS